MEKYILHFFVNLGGKIPNGLYGMVRDEDSFVSI
jgi:hypothetical protein